MGKSKIEWTERVWNPVTGCTKVSQGCKNCYAERMYERFNGHGSFKHVICHEDRLEIPLRVKKPSVFFVNSMSDLFHEDVPFEFIDDVFAVMALCPQHTFQVLTKRAERMVEWYKRGLAGFANSIEKYEEQGAFDFDINEPFAEVFPNVWMGVSVEAQKAADERIPLLMEVPAAVRWLSCEPLLGALDLMPYLVELNGIDWVVVGGESGPGARPMQGAWANALAGQCKVTWVPFFFKQWGEYNEEGVRVGKAKAGRLLYGKLYDEYPIVRQAHDDKK